jgi:hypothetical protein
MRIASNGVKRTPLRVNFKENVWDAVIKELAKKQLFATTIQRQLPQLSIGQVRYRVRKSGAQVPYDYRRGQGAAADAVIREAWARIRRMETIIRDVRMLVWSNRKKAAHKAR